MQVGEALLSIDMEDHDSEAEAVSTSSQDSASQASPTSSCMPAADAPIPADTQVTVNLHFQRTHGFAVIVVHGVASHCVCVQ